MLRERAEVLPKFSGRNLTSPGGLQRAPRGSARVIPLRPMVARRQGPAPQSRALTASQSLDPQQSLALRQAVAFAKAVMAQADDQGRVDYYDRWGNKVCLKP